MPRVYPSAYDRWLLLLLYASPLTLLLLAAFGYQQDRPELVGTCLMLAVALALVNLVLTWPCRYTLTEDTLNIRCGLLCRSIPLQRIVGAELSRSWQSSPAMSLRRVKIRLDDGGYRIISPADRQRFLDDLLAVINPPADQQQAAAKIG